MVEALEFPLIAPVDTIFEPVRRPFLPGQVRCAVVLANEMPRPLYRADGAGPLPSSFLPQRKQLRISSHKLLAVSVRTICRRLARSGTVHDSRRQVP